MGHDLVKLISILKADAYLLRLEKRIFKTFPSGGI